MLATLSMACSAAANKAPGVKSDEVYFRKNFYGDFDSARSLERDGRHRHGFPQLRLGIAFRLLC